MTEAHDARLREAARGCLLAVLILCNPESRARATAAGRRSAARAARAEIQSACARPSNRSSRDSIFVPAARRSPSGSSMTRADVFGVACACGFGWLGWSLRTYAEGGKPGLCPARARARASWRGQVRIRCLRREHGRHRFAHPSPGCREHQRIGCGPRGAAARSERCSDRLPAEVVESGHCHRKCARSVQCRYLHTAVPTSSTTSISRNFRVISNMPRSRGGSGGRRLSTEGRDGSGSVPGRRRAMR